MKRYFRFGLLLVGLVLTFTINSLAQDLDDSSFAVRFVESREVRLQDQTPREKIVNLTDLVVAAYRAGNVDKAREFAARLQAEVAGPAAKSVSYSDRALYVTNTVLGLMALDSGNVEEANDYLLASGKSGSHPTLQAFGPSMLLAKRLLEKGQSETVLQYLDQCAVFWKRDGGNLIAWKKAIEAGKQPDFGNQVHTVLGTWKYAQ